MTKLVCISDVHLDKETLGVTRAPEVERAMRQAETYAIRQNADAFLFLGDLADPDTGGATMFAVLIAQGVALRLAKRGIPSIWMVGNHDVYEDHTGATTLSPLRALEEHDPLIVVVEDPRTILVGDDVAIVCLPFAAVARAYDPVIEVKAHISMVKGRKVVIASHLNIPGIGPGEETFELPRGREVMLPLEETARAAFRISGHYHTRQDFDPGDGGPPIHVVGSPCAFAFGEHDGVAPAFSVVTL